MQSIIIFGAGKIAQAVATYIKKWNSYKIEAFVCDHKYVTQKTFMGKPWITPDQLNQYPPDQYGAFVAIGYQNLNNTRLDKVNELQLAGYEMVSIISPDTPAEMKYGKNCFVAGGEQIQPYVCIGNNVFIWSGAMIGHHTIIDDNCWITGGSLIGGVSNIGKGSFIAIGAVVGNEVSIGSSCILGANTLTTKDIEEGSVLVAEDTPPHRLNSKQFIRFSSCFVE